MANILRPPYNFKIMPICSSAYNNNNNTLHSALNSKDTEVLAAHED